MHVKKRLQVIFILVMINSIPLFAGEYYYHLHDHLGSVRVVVDKDANVIESYDYYPFGAERRSMINANQSAHLRFTGKELDNDLDLGLYYFGARYYDPEVGRFIGVDPLADEYPSVSSYAYCINNPVIFIDPSGMHPIYDLDGNFLGTDDIGLRGETIIMDANNFTQGMTNANALKNGTWLSNFEDSNNVKELILKHFSGLSERPDWDGIVTIEEGIAWAKNHPNNSGTPDDALYLDALKMDFGNLGKDDFKTIGEPENINLLWKTNLLSGQSLNTTYALGRTRMTLLNPILGGVIKVENGYWNVYDWNYGGGHIRNTLIFLNRITCGLNDSHGFPIHVYGVGLLNR